MVLSHTDGEGEILRLRSSFIKFSIYLQYSGMVFRGGPFEGMTEGRVVGVMGPLQKKLKKLENVLKFFVGDSGHPKNLWNQDFNVSFRSKQEGFFPPPNFLLGMPH